MSETRSRSRSPARDADAPADSAPPADDYQGGAPADNHGDGGEEVKLYVGNLDYGTDEERLRQVFGEFGTVTDVFLPKDRNSGRLRGFGFVSFADRQAAETAIEKMDQSQLDQRTIRVNESRPRGEGPGGPGGPGGRGGFNSTGAENVKLYVGNLSFDTTDEVVRGQFEKYGEVIDCFLPTDRESGKVRGFAFVTMKAADAEKACVAMNGCEVDGRTLKVNEAQPKGMGGGRGGYNDRGGGYGGGYGGNDYSGGYNDRGYGGGYGGGRGGYGGGRGGYDRGGYGGGNDSGYNDRGYGGGGGGGGGYGGNRGGGYNSYNDRGGYGGNDGGGYGGRGGYNDQQGGYGGGYGGGQGGGYEDRGGGYDNRY